MPQHQSRIDYKFIDKFDITLFLSAIILSTMGLLAIYSSTIAHPTASGNFEKQLVFFLFSILVFFVIYFLNPRIFHQVSVAVYVFSLLALIAVLFFGKTVYGAKSWISFGSLGFQPSEFAKIGLIFFLAYFLSRPKTEINSISGLALSLLIAGLPIGLILLEPDMGTAIVFIFVSLFMLFWSGLSLFGLFVVISPAIVSFASIFGLGAFLFSLALIVAALVYFKRDLFMSASVFVMNVGAGFFFDFFYKALSPHQQKRIEAFLDPTADPLGSGYNAIQAKVAIGSGGLMGKGFLSGHQTQLRFIPEQWTDFIFCVIGEEFGFIGSLFTIGVFLFLLIRIIKIADATKSKDRFSNLVVVGVLGLIFIHVAINVGMTVGIMPVIGLPLPFLSYGGSSLIVNFFLIAVVANIYRNRKHYA